MVTEARETGTLIGSDKVEGTAVYGADDTKIGTIERVMIDKTSGRVSYAVLSFGGFLGIGDDHYPLPWQSLKYDTNLGGYRTGITERRAGAVGQRLLRCRDLIARLIRQSRQLSETCESSAEQGRRASANIDLN